MSGEEYKANYDDVEDEDDEYEYVAEDEDDVEDVIEAITEENIQSHSETISLVVPKETETKQKNIFSSEQHKELIEKHNNIYNNKMVTYTADEASKSDIAFREGVKSNQIEANGKLLLHRINKNREICLWKNQNDFYYRSAPGNKIHKGSKKEISDKIEEFLDEPIRIVTYKEISKDNLIKHNIIEKYILVHQIPAIEDEVFEPRHKEFFYKDEILYKNSFLYTKYLKKRFQNIQNNTNNYNCFIIDFLENIANENTQDINNKSVTVAIMSWLSFFFQKMESSNIALVLQGSEEIAEDIFWEKLIIPIFGNEENCITIDDNILKLPIHEIIKDRIFFHIGSFTPTEENIKKINQLLKGILIDKYVLSNSIPPKRMPVYGQVLITATKDIIQHMHKYYSQFEYIDIQNETKVIKNLADNINDLALKFTDIELDTFSTYLAIFNFNIDMQLTPTSKIPTRQIETKTVSIDDKINAFIKAIKDKNIDYFEKVSGVTDKKGNDVYQQLVHAFRQNDGYFIGQDLYLYYNAIHGQNFKTNKSLMDKLKEKDGMFKQEIKTVKILNKDEKQEVLFQSYKTSKETGNKELYKINDYTMAKDITIPSGATIISSQTSYQKYTFEDEEDMSSCIERTEEYRNNKTKGKEKK